MSHSPPIYTILSGVKNQAVDAMLLEALEGLEPEYKRHAIDVLLARQRPPSIHRLLERYHQLPDACKNQLARGIARIEGTLRETIRSSQEQDRFNTIDVVLRSAAPAMSYLLGMGLHSAASSTRGRAAQALRAVVSECVGGCLAAASSAQAALQPLEDYHRLQREQAGRELLVATLREALGSYDVHMRTSVVEAVLMLCLHLEPEIRVEARRSQSKCWRAIMEMLRHAPGANQAPLVMMALGFQSTASEVAAIVSVCRSKDLMLAVVDEAWMLGDPAIRRGCGLIRKLTWLEHHPAVLFELDPRRLGCLVRFLQATSVPEPQLVQWYRSILLSDHRDKQRVALHAMVAIRSDPSSDVLRVVVDWADPDLARIALRELIQRSPQDRASLVERYTRPGKRASESELVAIACASFQEYWDGFPDMSDPLRKAVGRRVMSRDPEAFEQLEDRLSGSSGADRVRAIQVVKVLGLSERFKSAVFACSRDSDRVVRSAAVRALAQLHDGTAELILRSALEDDDSRVRANAIESMDDLGLQNTVDQIQPRLTDPDHRVRAAAIKALLKMQVREAAEALLRLLRDPSRAHRVSALWVIEQYGLASLLEQVSQIAESDPDEEVRSRARSMVQAERRRRRRQRRTRRRTPTETET